MVSVLPNRVPVERLKRPSVTTTVPFRAGLYLFEDSMSAFESPIPHWSILGSALAFRVCLQDDALMQRFTHRLCPGPCPEFR